MVLIRTTDSLKWEPTVLQRATRAHPTWPWLCLDTVGILEGFCQDGVQVEAMSGPLVLAYMRASV